MRYQDLSKEKSADDSRCVYFLILVPNCVKAAEQQLSETNYLLITARTKA